MHFKRVISVIIVLSFLFAPVIGAKGNPSYIYPLSSPVYSLIEDAYLLEGLGHPSSSKPWSGDEVDMMLTILERNATRNETRLIIEKVRKENDSHSSESPKISFSLSISPEIYAHSNGEEYNLESSWIHGFDYRNPFLEAGIELNFSDRFYTYCNLGLGWGRTTYLDEWTYLKDIPGFSGVGAIVDKDDEMASVVTSSYLYSKSFLFSFPDIDKLNIETPTRNLISFGGDGWFLTLSKDKLEWNKSHIGSFIFDSHLEYQEYLRFKNYGEKLSLEYVMEFFDTDTSNRVSSSGGDKYRIMMAHALSFRPLDSLLFTLSENIMYVSEGVDLHYLNPSTIFHNLNNSDLLNAIAHVAVSYAPIKGLDLYGQFVLDQATAPTESNEQASAWGLSMGAEGAVGLDTGIIIWNFEGAYTTPELYRRQYSDFLLFQRYSTNVNYKRFLFFDYIGFPYGGDAIVVEAGVAWKDFKGFEIGVEGEYMIHGEMDYFTSHSIFGDNTKVPDIKDNTPYGEATKRITLSLYEEWNIKNVFKYGDVKVRGALDWTKGSEDKGDLQFTFGATIII